MATEPVRVSPDSGQVVGDFDWSEDAPHVADYLGAPILEIAREVAPSSILDAGCGNGALAAMLTAEGYRVTGVDNDPAGLQIARGKCPFSTFMLSDFASAPPGRFDMVVSTEVVEHLFDPRLLARYCFAALRPGGTLAMTTPYHGYLKNLAIAVAGKWDSHHDPHWLGGHIKFWSRRTLTKLLADAGLIVTDLRGVGRVRYLWRSMILIARRPRQIGPALQGDRTVPLGNLQPTG